MKIRILESVAGIDPDTGKDYDYVPGDVLTLSGRVAYDLVTGKIAELMPEDGVELAEAPAPEVAVTRGRGGRRRGQRA